MPGQQDLWPWLQSILGNQGAANPLDPNAIPAAAPQGMPGAIVNGMPAMTPGGPSMGFPAQTNPFGAQAAAQAVSAGNDGGYNNPMMAAANAPMVPGAAPGQGGIGSDARFAPATPAPPTFNWPASSTPTGMPAPPPAGSPSATPRPADSAKGPLASPGASAAAPMKRTPGAANLGYYQPNNRFTLIDRPNADPQNSMRAGPQATALNLPGLFGGRGQQPAAPTANPNAPAPNAQPVSSAAPPGRQAPDMSGVTFDANGNPMPDYGDPANWGMGPLQQGRNWTGRRPFKGSSSSQGGGY